MNRWLKMWASYQIIFLIRRCYQASRQDEQNVRLPSPCCQVIHVFVLVQGVAIGWLAKLLAKLQVIGHRHFLGWSLFYLYFQVI